MGGWGWGWGWGLQTCPTSAVVCLQHPAAAAGSTALRGAAAKHVPTVYGGWFSFDGYFSEIWILKRKAFWGAGVGRRVVKSFNVFSRPRQGTSAPSALTQ